MTVSRRPARTGVLLLVLAGAVAGGVLGSGCSASGTRPSAAASASGAPASGSPSSPAAGGSDPAGPGQADQVTVFELADPLVHYQEYVAAQLATLAGQTAALARDTTAGDDAAARRDWLAAHLTYHRVGAAYGAFGDLGQAIDGLPAGLPRGADDPGFTGFHAVERVLWRGAGARAAAPLAARLAADVRTLAGKAASLDVKPNEVTVRAHEILEDTLRFTLTGADDCGSGTGLATVLADLDATRTVIGMLRPVLERRSPGLTATILTKLATVQAAVPGSPASPGAGTGVPVPSLPLPQRQRLDAAVGGALETLSLVPGLLEVPEED